MKIVTQDDLITSALWWQIFRVEPEDKLELYFQQHFEDDESPILIVAKFDDPTETLDLYKALLIALEYQKSYFNVNDWYSEYLSSKEVPKSV
jgi:hypothetical protein